MELVKSRVEFNEVEHTYTLDGKQLRGITGILHEYICPGKYDGIPQATLAAAAARGHEIHSQCQMIIDGFGYANPAPEVKAFFDTPLVTSFIAAEYLVSDEQNFASSIDIVDDDLNLYDIKTTSTLDKEYLSWQLSIYAYLFEKQNPTLKVKGLYGAHLRDGAAIIVPIERIDDAIVADLLSAAADGLPWANPLKEVGESLMQGAANDLARLADIETAIADIEAKAKAYAAERDQLKDGLLALMQQNGVKTFETDRLKLSVREASTRTTLDSAAVKKDLPEVFEKYAKTSPVKASLTIKIKE